MLAQTDPASQVPNRGPGRVRETHRSDAPGTVVVGSAQPTRAAYLAGSQLGGHRERPSAIGGSDHPRVYPAPYFPQLSLAGWVEGLGVVKARFSGVFCG